MLQLRVGIRRLRTAGVNDIEALRVMCDRLEVRFLDLHQITGRVGIGPVGLDVLRLLGGWPNNVPCDGRLAENPTK